MYPYITLILFVLGMMFSMISMMKVVNFAGKTISHAKDGWEFSIRCFPILLLFGALFDIEGKESQKKLFIWIGINALSFSATILIGLYRENVI